MTSTYTYTDPTLNPQTLTLPYGVNSLTIQCWGGGGGGSTIKNIVLAGGGGGGGAFAQSTTGTYLSFTPGTVYTIYVGSGGTATSPGAPSYVTYGKTNIVCCSADNGKGAAQNSATGVVGGYIINCIGDISYAGGLGGTGSGAKAGGGGGCAGTGGGGGAGGNSAGGTGNDSGGNGGNGYSGGPGFGFSGSTYGGGGGGAVCAGSGNETGGSGANGGCVVSYTWPGNNVVLNVISSTFS
jgi:hypothetical protein